MNGSLDYKLGEIATRLDAIEKRLDHGSERYADIDKRIDRLDLIEAKRGGVIAAVAALAGVVGSAVGLAFPLIARKFGG
jgi:hypothetical protein